MSAREWKPGDVARVRYGAVDEVALVRHRPAACHALEFAYVSNGFDMVDDLPPNADVRPLVVIDPEDAEQVERLWRAWTTHAPDYRLAQDNMQAALREFANPTPPKPPEPQGLGAVVEDRSRERWVRVNTNTGTQEWRCCDYNGEFRRWDAIDAAKVLSEGVPA